MSASVQPSVGTAVREFVPFLVVMLLWIVVMSVLYGIFLVSKPADVTYSAAVHASVFVPGLIGFIGHTALLVLRGARAD